MRFKVTPGLIASLQSARAQTTREPDDLERSEGAFALEFWYGPPAYLTADGRVLINPRAGDDDAPIREATEDEAVGSLVLGARYTGVRGLLGLIPAGPVGASVCPVCAGTRWCKLINQSWCAASEQDEARPLVCFRCHGRGWVHGEGRG